MRRVILGVLIVTSLTWLAISTPILAADKGQTTEKVFGEPKENQALVYFMREGNFAGGGVSVFVFSETQLITVVPNNSYNFAYLAPGKHILWWGRSFPGLEVEFEPGEVYYVDLSISFKKRDRFMDEQSASELLEKIKFYFVPTAENRKKADKFMRKNYAKVKALPPETAGARKYCPYPEELFRIDKSQSIALRPVVLETNSPYPQEVTDKWEQELPLLIAKSLKKQGYKNVEIVGEDESGTSDVTVTGKFMQIRKGSGMGRTFGSANAQSAAFMRVDFSVSESSAPESSIDIHCSRTGYGVGGVLFGTMSGSSKRIMHNNMERIAERLAEIFKESAEGEGDQK